MTSVNGGNTELCLFDYLFQIKLKYLEYYYISDKAHFMKALTLPFVPSALRSKKILDSKNFSHKNFSHKNA